MIPSMIDALRQVAAHPETISGLAPYAQHVAEMQPDEINELLRQIVELVESPQVSARREPLDQGVQAIFQAMVQWRHRQADLAEPLKHEYGVSLALLYDWALPESPLRNLILAWLAHAGSEEVAYPPALERWCELVCRNPPENRSSIQLAFGALLKTNFDPPMWLLERLLKEGIVHSQIAPAIFDLFNFFYREEVLERHPAADRAEELCGLVAKLGNSLREIEQGGKAVQNPERVGKQVSDSVAMLVALSDALALLDDRSAIPTLEALMDLKHRRVQTEIAAALARLGSDEGRQALVKLAEEPVCRLRVLAYAEELGFENEISLEYRGEIAKAESELAIWLAEPQQVGVAPTTVQLVDHRDLFWPSYDEPRSCFLFEYTYGTGANATRNIGMSGPLTYAFPADLTELDLDDVYALFAGWQAVHQEIFQMTADRAAQVFPNEWNKIMAEIEHSDYMDPIVEAAASFFGRLTGVVRCRMPGFESGMESTPGTAIVAVEESWFVPEGNEKAPIDWELALCIWRGRQLLANFNPAN